MAYEFVDQHMLAHMFCNNCVYLVCYWLICSRISIPVLACKSLKVLYLLKLLLQYLVGLWVFLKGLTDSLRCEFISYSLKCIGQSTKKCAWDFWWEESYSSWSLISISWVWTQSGVLMWLLSLTYQNTDWLIFEVRPCLCTSATAQTYLIKCLVLSEQYSFLALKKKRWHLIQIWSPQM